MTARTQTVDPAEKMMIAGKNIKAAFVVVVGSAFWLLGMPAQAEQAIGSDGARHLLNRSGFAAGQAHIQEVSRLCPIEAAGPLRQAANTLAATPPPPWLDDAPIPPG